MPISDDDLAAARAHLAAAQTLLTPVTAPPAVRVTPGTSLQTVHDATAEGSVIQLDGGNYPGTLKSTKRLAWTVTPGANVNLIGAGSALVNAAQGATFGGMVFQSSDPTATVISDAGDGLVLTNFGVSPVDAKLGQRRGIRMDGTNFTFSKGGITGCKLPGKDSQTLCAWDGLKNGQILDMHLEAAAEGIMIGGADSSSVDRIPTGLLVQRCYVTKQLAWYTDGSQIKNAVELKVGKKMTFKDNVFEYGGVAEGQSAYVCVLTVRDQSGTAPWSVIEDASFDNCLFRYGAGGVNFLGSDNNHPDDGTVMARVSFNNCVFEHLNPNGPWVKLMSGRAFLFDRAPQDVHLSNITIGSDAKMNADFYHINPLAVRLMVSNLDQTKYTASYSWKIDNGGQGLNNFLQLAPDAAVNLAPVPGQAPGATLTGYPASIRSQTP